MIRKVKISDAKAITKIYNYYISESTSTLELETISYTETEKRIRKITEKEELPYLVYEKNGVVIAYAYSTIWRHRAGYKYSIESSVYVKKGSFNKNLGSKLYLELIKQLEKLNYKAIIAVLTLPNDPSVKFHEKLGFEKVGFFKKVGRKFDQWHDVGFWMLSLKD